jgi:hypothetical protein
MKKQTLPMPTVDFEGKTYSLRSRKTVIPDFSEMTSIQQLMWINKNTTARGYTTKTNPLAGMSHLLLNNDKN